MLQNDSVQMEEGWPPVHKKLAPPLMIIIVSYQQVIDT